MKVHMFTNIRIKIACLLFALAPIMGISAAATVQPQSEFAELEHALETLSIQESASYTAITQQMLDLWSLLNQEYQTNPAMKQVVVVAYVEYSFIVMKDSVKRLLNVLLSSGEDFITTKLPETATFRGFKTQALPRLASFKHRTQTTGCCITNPATTAQVDQLFAILDPHIKAIIQHIQTRANNHQINVTNPEILNVLKNQKQCNSLASDFAAILRRKIMTTFTHQDMTNIIIFFQNKNIIKKFADLLKYIDTAIETKLNPDIKQRIQQGLKSIIAHAQSAFLSITSKFSSSPSTDAQAASTAAPAA